MVLARPEPVPTRDGSERSGVRVQVAVCLRKADLEIF
jgi:hypothetical protein